MSVKNVKTVPQPYDFTTPELEQLRYLCNFSDDELKYFDLRAKHKSNTFISLEMHVSEPQVSKLAKRVRDKIKRVIHLVKI